VLAASVLVVTSLLFAAVAEADQAGSSMVSEGPRAPANPAATPDAATPASVMLPPIKPKRPSRFDYSLSAAVGFPLGNIDYNTTANRGIVQGGFAIRLTL